VAQFDWSKEMVRQLFIILSTLEMIKQNLQQKLVSYKNLDNSILYDWSMAHIEHSLAPHPARDACLPKLSMGH
jgi:hypothetical protein